jgi:hypothetical protein
MGVPEFHCIGPDSHLPRNICVAAFFAGGAGGVIAQIASKGVLLEVSKMVKAA